MEWALVVVTGLLCVATFLMAQATATIARSNDRNWKPILMVKFTDTREPYKDPKEGIEGKSLPLCRLVHIENKGHSDAVQIKWGTYVSYKKQPKSRSADFEDEQDKVLSPGGSSQVELKFNKIEPGRGKRSVFYHVVIRHKDREGKNYKRETVFEVPYVGGGRPRDGYGYYGYIYEWVKDFRWAPGKWVDIGLFTE